MTDPVPSKDLVYELRRDVLRFYEDERQLKHDSAAEIERLERKLARPAHEREPPHCSSCSCGIGADIPPDGAPSMSAPEPGHVVTEACPCKGHPTHCYRHPHDCGCTAAEPPVDDSCKEPEPCVAQMALDSLQASIGRLSMSMGNPAVHWDENSSLESAVIDEAARRLAQPPGAGDR
jgi:hypothetical protein